jgi:hypothetical protein
MGGPCTLRTGGCRLDSSGSERDPWRGLVNMVWNVWFYKALWQSQLQSSGNKQEKRMKWMRIWPFISVRICKCCLHALKSYDMGPPALLSPRRKVCFGFLSHLKIHHIGRVLTPESWVQWQTRRSASCFIIYRLNCWAVSMLTSRIATAVGYHKPSSGLIDIMINGSRNNLNYSF